MSALYYIYCAFTILILILCVVMLIVAIPIGVKRYKRQQRIFNELEKKLINENKQAELKTKDIVDVMKGKKDITDLEKEEE